MYNIRVYIYYNILSRVLIFNTFVTRSTNGRVIVGGIHCCLTMERL